MGKYDKLLHKSSFYSEEDPALQGSSPERSKILQIYEQDLALDVSDSELEDQGLTCHRVSTRLAISLFRRYGDFFLFVDCHAEQGFLEALDDLCRSKLHLERFVISGRSKETALLGLRFDRGIENLATNVFANIVYRNGVSFLRSQT